MIVTDDERTLQRRALGERLRLARKAAGMSQIDVAEVCGTTRAFVSLVEKGETGIDPEKVGAIANFLNIEVEWLMWGKGKTPDLKPPKEVRRALRPAHGGRLGWTDVLHNPPFDGAIPLMRDKAGQYTTEAESPSNPKKVRDWILLPPFMLQQTGATTDARKLRIMEMASADMIKVPRGSFALIDYSKKSPRDGEVFAINNGLSIIIRRIVDQVGQPTKIGLGDAAGVQIIPRRNLKVCGKVVAVLNAL